MSNLFVDEIEQTAIVRIQKFAKIAEAYGFEVALGFSGGKDSQVCYDLCKRAGIEFKAYYNVAFESATTKRFISPKANFTHNYKALIRYPKLIDAFIRALEKNPVRDWVITSDNKDYSNDKVYYICRWLNRSFRVFTKRQELEYKLVREAYNKKKDECNTNGRGVLV